VTFSRELAQGRSVGEICRGLWVSEASYYRWRSEYGGLNQVRRLKELERGIFCPVREAEVLIERWRRHYNTVRLHSAFGYRPPATAEKAR
jgi:hypothetical protein